MSWFGSFDDHLFICLVSLLIKAFPGTPFGRSTRFIFQCSNSLYAFSISSRYLFRYRVVTTTAPVPSLWSIAWFSLQNCICCSLPGYVLSFCWLREHEIWKFSLLRLNFHFAPSSTVLQNIKCYFFKFGYVLRYKLSKMQIFFFR